MQLSSLDGDEWSGLCHGHFTPGKSPPSTHSIEHFGEE